MDTTFLDNFSVLILEESSTLQALFSDWISGVTTKTVSSTSSVPREFDSTITVACLSQTALSDEGSTVLKYILSRNPYCQIVGIVPRSSFISPFEGEFDEILQRPIYKDEFQQSIEPRFISGAYSTLLSELYDVNSSLIAIQRASEDEVKDKMESVAKIRARREELNRQLNSLRGKLPAETLLSILSSIERHNRYLTKPEADMSSGRPTKFRARRCPACKLPWGVDHRNDLGNGFNRLGADVYQCAGCEKILHGLAGEQRVL